LLRSRANGFHSLGDAAQSAKCRGSLQQPLCQEELQAKKTENGRFYVGFEKWKWVRKVPDNLRHVGNDGLWHVTLWQAALRSIEV